ncbi:SelT/SelW/SelH family protein [Corallincola holothuriorum]|uniref:SelT/SelW/SelH family protein n=1 Tax=Corallincola holothuriorum TaxID=2282215 RepID=A0A368NRL6_9GAMM|nr:SelT/SelW/SelH family protein [Corallincola holothuriorum]RCU51901.1 SelT/SelW/SelH family protein [Corallincola holothuriorum]
MSELIRLNKIEIRYCPRCRWMMRAAWVSQELLNTFSEELDSVAIGPGDAGQFDIWLDGALIWCRKEMGGFPELKPLKQKIRDLVAPERDLGHSDRK